MILAHHLMWTVYGRWLPNDPRGSTSTQVRNPRIRELGEPHYGRKRVQPSGKELRGFFARAEQVLMHPVIEFDREMISQAGVILGELILADGYTCYACAVMPDHVHFVIRVHRDKGQEMIAKLQEASAEKIRSLGPYSADHPVWTKGGFTVYLNTPQEIRTRIRYVERNPLERGLPRQRWEFVRAYDGWPYHKR